MECGLAVPYDGQMQRLPLKSELVAATEAAAEAGLGGVSPALLHLGNHTSVRLDPWPIVARIASGTSFDFSDGNIGRELAIAAHLAARHAPAVRPVPDIWPGPYLTNGCAVTLWELVGGHAVERERDAILAAASLKQVHAALVDIDIALPGFIEKVKSCEAILSDPAEARNLAANDRSFLQRLYEMLVERVNRIDRPQQPLHGDPHFGNVLIGDEAAIWMDLEAACIGPLEWDVAILPSTTWPAFAGIDADLTRLMADVRSLCVAVWCWAEFDRSTETAAAATDQLDRLKARFG